MKKLISLLISVLIAASVFTSLPFSASAAVKRVSLKKTSATLKISKKSGKTVYGTVTVPLKKVKGVTLKKVTYKSSNKKIATVNSKGKIKAKKKGSAKITVKVSFKYKKRSYKKTMAFKVTVKDTRVKTPTTPSTPTEKITIPTEFGKKLSAFSNKLYKMTSKNVTGNYSMSPVSVYMALAMLYNVADDNVKAEIESFVEMDESDIANTGDLFKALDRKVTFGNEILSRLSLTNSIWYDDSETFNEEALQKLNEALSCSSHSVPFKNNNSNANQQIRDFIKEATNGLIDKDFELNASTLFALINTLYFKDVWDEERESLSTDNRNFTPADGNTAKREFVIGEYVHGKVQETEKAKYFYAVTAHGYKFKLILPKSGFTLDEAMSEKSLNEINQKSDFGTYDADGTEHYTRCIFPSFKIESETPLMEIFKQNNVLSNAFTCFSSPLTETPLELSEAKHNVVLDVSKHGIEGAAVTIFAAKAGAAFPTHPIKYHDFVLNKSFGFIVTDPSDVILFEGQVTE